MHINLNADSQSIERDEIVWKSPLFFINRRETKKKTFHCEQTHCCHIRTLNTEGEEREKKAHNSRKQITEFHFIYQIQVDIKPTA